MTLMSSMAGMGAINDEVIANDLLQSAKSAIKGTAIALSEAATPDVRNALRRQLDDAVSFHEQVANYAMSNGYYHPHNISEQMRTDMKYAQNAMNLGD